MTVPEVTENEIESPPVLIENQESYCDRNDQSISEHLESNYDPTVHSFYSEEVVTAENFFNSAKLVLFGSFFSLMFDFDHIPHFLSLKKGKVTRLLEALMKIGHFCNMQVCSG